LRAALEALTPRIAARAFEPGDLRAILAGLVDDGINGQYRDYAGAEQATMAISSVLDFLARRGELADVRAANAALDRLHREVRDDEKYRPAQFVEALTQLRGIVIR
jgi:hypothetical protein